MNPGAGVSVSAPPSASVGKWCIMGVLEGTGSVASAVRERLREIFLQNFG